MKIVIRRFWQSESGRNKLTKKDKKNISKRREYGNTNWTGFTALVVSIWGIGHTNLPLIPRLFILAGAFYYAATGLRKSAGSKFLPIVAMIVSSLGFLALISTLF